MPLLFLTQVKKCGKRSVLAQCVKADADAKTLRAKKRTHTVGAQRSMTGMMPDAYHGKAERDRCDTALPEIRCCLLCSFGYMRREKQHVVSAGRKQRILQRCKIGARIRLLMCDQYDAMAIAARRLCA